jgi:sugar O-acyltransferase (sialic acid O-acetyltransferase NeuD family)
MRKLIVIGAGGLAKQILPIIAAKYSRIVFYDTTESPVEMIRGFSVQHNIEESHVSGELFTVAIGDPKYRKQYYELLCGYGAIPCDIKAKTITADLPFMFGNIILDFVHIEDGGERGHGNLINAYAGIFHDAVIGDFNEIMPRATILGGAKIGNMCRIGTGAIILPKVSVCDNVVIGAGAVVTKDITEAGTYVGVPAKKIK